MHFSLGIAALGSDFPHHGFDVLSAHHDAHLVLVP